MSDSIFDSIRSASAEVCRRARWVQVDRQRIDSYARSLPLDKVASPTLDPRSHYLGSADDTLAFFVTLDAINFGSGYFPFLHKRPGMSGYFTMATCLTEHFQTHGAISAEELSTLTSEQCRVTFQQQADAGPIDELMSLFARALNDLGRLLIEAFDGQFTALVAACGGSAGRLVQTLARMPLYRDVQKFDDFEVPFYKRAQLTAADLTLALGGTGLGRFADLNQLTIFADNLVPHVLRVDGVLCYDDELAAQIDRGELVAAGSNQEIEIRAGAVHACELIVETVRGMGRSVISTQIDYLLWNRGQEPHYKARPRHRTRSVFY